MFQIRLCFLKNACKSLNNLQKDTLLNIQINANRVSSLVSFLFFLLVRFSVKGKIDLDDCIIRSIFPLLQRHIFQIEISDISIFHIYVILLKANRFPMLPPFSVSEKRKSMRMIKINLCTFFAFDFFIIKAKRERKKTDQTHH